MSEERDSKSDASTPDDSPAAASEEKSGGAASDAAATDAAATDGAATDEPSEPAAPERVDADGLPLDRDATIDDVRSTEARHGRIALGCTLVIVLFIVLFWALRGGLIG